MLVSTCEASAHPCTGRVTVLHPSWWPRSRRLARSSAALVTIASLQPSSDRRGRCTICGCQFPSPAVTATASRYRRMTCPGLSIGRS